jgi:hypothetical protein
MQVDGLVWKEAYTSLKGVCEFFGVSYNSALRGKKVFIKEDVVYRIFELDLVKIKR